jgi:hypothetical protein
VHDLDEPGSSAHRQEQPATRRRSIRFVGGSYRIPLPPGPPPGPSKAEREQEAQIRARGDVRVARFHLLGLFSVGVVVSGLAVAIVVVMFVPVVLSHH